MCMCMSAYMCVCVCNNVCVWVDGCKCICTCIRVNMEVVFLALFADNRYTIKIQLSCMCAIDPSQGNLST